MSFVGIWIKNGQPVLFFYLKYMKAFFFFQGQNNDI